MAKRITPDELNDAINEILEDYSAGLVDKCNRITESVAQYGASDLRERAKASGIKGRKYVNSFRAEMTEKSPYGNVWTIRSTQYRLTHLLEHGHRVISHGKVTGKRTHEYHHWSKTEDTVIKRFEEEIRHQIEQESR